MKMVFLDSHALNPGDLSWSPLETLGSLTVYDRTPSDLIVERAQGAEVLLTNKKRMTEEIFAQLPDLRLVLVSATGYDTIDVAAARRHGVAVCNVPAYSTLAVAQHTLALLLEHCNQVGHYAEQNRHGYWSQSVDFCLWDKSIVELTGKRISLVGFGNIGQKVAQLLQVLEAEVCVVTSKSQDELPAGLLKIDLETAFATSHFVSLHCPLTPDNRAMVNAELLAKAKPGLVLVNTARGGLIDDAAVAQALTDGQLAAYACDVLSQEPPPADHPILSAPNTLVTPHVAWASSDARGRIVQIMADNLAAFKAGTPQNVVN
ncbi:MAG: D-2-hydroxyacid dehydrogenase [Bacteroidaceae bacterium]|nr:D-2-hydroxyacid dehydrogenase [Bacteroidaceae bacterium]